MIQYKKIIMTLALLLTAVTGAWAEEKMVTINSSTMSSGAVTATGFNIFENYLYVSSNTATITTSEGVITKLVIKKGDLYGDGFTEANVGVTPGTITYGSDEITVTDINAESVTLSRKGGDNWSTSAVDVYYGEPTEWPLTPDANKKVWTLAKMPANDIELQVEYYAESNLFLGKEALADKANISVLNGSTAVTFDDEGKSTTTVTEGNTVTVTYTGSKKIIGVKAEKKAKAAEKTITIGEQNYTVLDGETWKQFITRNQLSGWYVDLMKLSTWGVFIDEPYSKLHVSSDGTNWTQLVFSSQDAPIDTDKQYKWVQEEIGSGGVGVGEPLF